MRAPQQSGPWVAFKTDGILTLDSAFVLIYVTGHLRQYDRRHDDISLDEVVKIDIRE